MVLVCWMLGIQAMIQKLDTVGIWNPTIWNPETFKIHTFWRSDFKWSLRSQISNDALHNKELLTPIHPLR